MSITMTGDFYVYPRIKTRTTLPNNKYLNKYWDTWTLISFTWSPCWCACPCLLSKWNRIFLIFHNHVHEALVVAFHLLPIFLYYLILYARDLFCRIHIWTCHLAGLIHDTCPFSFTIDVHLDVVLIPNKIICLFLRARTPSLAAYIHMSNEPNKHGQIC